MKILFLTNDGEGIYKFRKEVVEALLKNNDVFLSLPEDNYIPKLVDMGCKYIKTEFNRKGTNPIKDLSLLVFYKKLINEIKPDVVLTYTIKPNVYGGLACQIMKVPYIANITGGVGASDKTGIIQNIAITLYKLAFKRVNKVFFQNTANMKYMMSKGIVSEDKCILIPGSGVNLNDYKVLEFPNGETVDFVYIGRIMTEKGFKQYIEAAEYIRNKYPMTRFHICGIYEDDYKNIVEDLVKRKIVIYHGSLIDMNQIYKIIQCTIHPTYYSEGMSNVLLESSACGRPIITTNRPGSGEVVDDDINGFIVKEKDSKDLIKQIEKFLSLSLEQRRQMGLNGRKKVEEQFDRNIVVNKYLEEVNKLR